MKIIKKINTSAAIALDSLGNEVVVLGKGIGFPAVPYELNDLSKIERTFYDVDSKYFNLIKHISTDILSVSADIANMAEEELDAELNPNLAFTLADHLAFAVERLRKGLDLTGAISYDIKHLYPKEAEVANKALKMFKDKVRITLPSSESASITMHLINAELKVNDYSSIFNLIKITQEIRNIIEKNLHVKMNENSYEYSRFMMHVRYLIQRISKGVQLQDQNEMLLSTMKMEYPMIDVCANEIMDYLKETWGWPCNNDEKLYLMIYINRVINSGATTK
ncbi:MULTISPECIES: PRD domain-containing protein [Faecalicoccus]|uniref:PRD domain-containing protein n=1 Tax=Faecalicoccus pleomorphus TaxID=1323 RepID=A0AAW6CPE8_9FIRM|nr:MULTISPECIES: PRD domain-containing protein [Faecalicoccus]MDB7980150.1 PRD domain-containing protein [Faecalicoccus pleomorphus]MDB7982444.1 PRD domain-containing protein [Faecalicoccus pleomorphus]MDB7987713.1 PRD domain-containing protein [Faecalicoccus pleomorphus]MDB7992242.1 PRD domain-containing protein [Faecalicoccus pleomorphus]MDY5111666.1 PRD domain-containing protein [Faecalicoccus sp.]